MPADDRFSGLPIALIAHIVGAAVYALIGVLQFVPGFRRGHMSAQLAAATSQRIEPG